MKPAANSLAKKKYAIPHVYIILFIIILLATVLTYIVPAGQFDRETVDNVKMVIPGTYHRIDQTPVNLFDMFVAIPQGFVSMANIVILIYMCVAGMGILTSTGALERVFGSFISKVGAKGRVVMLIIFYAFFFVRGGLTGSVNSPIAFIPLVVTLCLAVGYDVMTALGVVAVGALVGFAVGPTNPNTVVVAQQICELPIYSGMTFRTITWLVLGLAGLIYVVIYAEKVRKNPSASLSSYKPDTQELQNENMQKAATTRDKWVVFTLFVAVVAVVVLTVKFSLSMVQMAGLYIIIGIIGGLVAGYKPNEIAAMFTKYGKELRSGKTCGDMRRIEIWVSIKARQSCHSQVRIYLNKLRYVWKCCDLLRGQCCRYDPTSKEYSNSIEGYIPFTPPHYTRKEQQHNKKAQVVVANGIMLYGLSH